MIRLLMMELPYIQDSYKFIDLSWKRLKNCEQVRFYTFQNWLVSAYNTILGMGTYECSS